MSDDRTIPCPHRVSGRESPSRLLGGDKKVIAQRRAYLREELIDAIADLGIRAVEQIVREVLVKSSV